MKGPTFDQERVSFNLARLRKGGEQFELAIDADAAVKFKEEGGTIEEVVNAQKIFSDTKKGLVASEETVEAVFGTKEFEQVARKILDEGEIQLTTEHRDRIRAQKLRKLIARIHRGAVDPKTHSPHPEKRIQLAFDEAKIKIDEFKSVEKQLPDVVKKLQPILPIKFEQVVLSLHVPPQYAGAAFAEVAKLHEVQKQEWHDDGSCTLQVEVPAGIKNDVIETINSLTHGGASVDEKVKR